MHVYESYKYFVLRKKKIVFYSVLMKIIIFII